MSTKRYTEEIITDYVKNKNYQVIAIRVLDKFGDNGVTGVAIINKIDKKLWQLDTFLLSCRIIGRKVEETLLAFIINQAKDENIISLQGEFIPSKKNKPAEKFYFKSGFKKLNDTKSGELWEFDLRNDFPYPNFINFKIK